MSPQSRVRSERKFRDLYEKMSPEAKADVEKRVKSSVRRLKRRETISPGRPAKKKESTVPNQ